MALQPGQLQLLGGRDAAGEPALPGARYGHDFLDLTYRGPIRGKDRPRSSLKDGRLRIHSDPKMRDAERGLAWAMRASFADQEPLDFDLQLLIELRFPAPKSWPKWKRAEALAGQIRPRVKPDCDNVLKLIMDAGNAVVWRDDSLISSLQLERCYIADAPLIWLRVRRAPPPPFWRHILT